MATIDVDAAYRCLQAMLGEPQTWAQIEPVRKLIPASIQRKEHELEAALEALDMAADLNEQARTDVTCEALGEATERVNVICKELEFLREMFLNNPAYFEEA